MISFPFQKMISQQRIRRQTGRAYCPLGNTAPYTVYPHTEEEIALILRHANERGLTVIPEGGGTKRGWGGTKENVDFLLSLSEYKGIIEHSPGDMIVTVRAGTTIQELKEGLAAHKQMLPLDPPWPEFATIGGVVATNESGPKRLRYGSARDHVIGLRVVYPDGTVIRTGGKVVKNVAGYDMNKLFIGSMGTLGVISEISLKLRPLPQYESLVLLVFPEKDIAAMRPFVVSLLDSVLEPFSLELLSPTLTERMYGENGYMLAIAFEDVEKAVRYQEEWIQSHRPPVSRMYILECEKAEKWWDDFSRISPRGVEEEGLWDARVTVKIGSKNMDVLDIVPMCHMLGQVKGITVKARGGAGHGLSYVYIGEHTEETLLSYIEEVRSFIGRKGGYAIIQHAPLALRQKIEVWGGTPSSFFLLEGIKRSIDPNRILNPGRFIGGI
ncbi:FAD-binding oxidoreductase [Aneurinibacillus thermoaerophilus]|uniref:FAD-binding oxidoreductase n=1 Tax=Aneurinibacillus thermoaerophilus TaxID=143495 RepID=UPI002E1DEAEB|nr:FAD-binding oxidoreductase [Aneurinibacillus thermoaerophilus]